MLKYIHIRISLYETVKNGSENRSKNREGVVAKKR
jgi:hypothetical protein